MHGFNYVISKLVLYTPVSSFLQGGWACCSFNQPNTSQRCTAKGQEAAVKILAGCKEQLAPGARDQALE